MKILVTGGTGFVGTGLTRKLLEQGHQVTVVSSSGKTSLSDSPALNLLVADTSQEGDWQKELPLFDVIVNLTGRSVFHLWSKSYKEKILLSRVATTKNIVNGLPKNSNAVLLSGSAAGYYGNGDEVELDENSPPGKDFLAEVCKQWEEQALMAREKGVRVAIMRLGVVLGADGGAIATMKTPFKLGLGGPIGNGEQWFPWIHLKDLLEAICLIIDRDDMAGIFNMTAPGLVKQKEFARTLGKVLHRPACIPAPAIVMKLLLGQFGNTLLMGQKVVPRALLKKDFSFTYPDLYGALEEILRG